ncbi:MAG: deacetylase [Thermoplasmata archaeon]|nr:deacetylase [Thermoplasmata archaeon]
MAKNEGLRDFLKHHIKEGNAEVGAHLHPWDNPPYVPLTPDDQKHHPLPHELPEDLFRKKMGVLTDSIKHGFGAAPVSYRAGRWGLNEMNARVLIELGYIVDSSVTPNITWSHLTGIPGGEGGKNYLHAPLQPYWLDIADVTRPGSSNLLEVPVTILFTQFPMRKLRFMRHVFRNHRTDLIGRALDRFGFGPTWLRPYPQTTGDKLIRVYQTAKSLDLPAVVMMLHSSELMPGGSPYNPDERSVERLYKKLETLFSYVSNDGTTANTLKEFAGEWGKARPLKEF